MIRHLFIVSYAALFAVSCTGRVLRAEDYSPFFVPAYFDSEVRRLPPVDPLPSSAAREKDEHVVTPDLLDSPIEPEPVPIEPESKPGVEVPLWKGSFELGFNGSEGNSKTLNFRFGFDVKRKTTINILDLDLDYHKKTADTQETANRLFLDSRWEWLLDDSPWTWFVRETTEYDEFKVHDVRVTLDTGLGYQFVDTEATSLTGRLGGGVSREIGGPDDSWVPELTVGLDFEHQLTDRQKLSASADYMPDVTDFGAFRLNTKAGWETILDDEMNLSLKVSILDRYDSTPNGAEANDLDYAITLLWSF